MELESLLLSGEYQWEDTSPASEQDIAALVAATEVRLPADYLAMFRISDGGTAMRSDYPTYVRIWPAKLAVDRNRNYQVRRWLPGFVGFGDNGRTDMVGFDTRNGLPYPVCAVPFAPMEWDGAMGQCADFESFLRQLLPVGAKAPD